MSEETCGSPGLERRVNLPRGRRAPVLVGLAVCTLSEGDAWESDGGLAEVMSVLGSM